MREKSERQIKFKNCEQRIYVGVTLFGALCMYSLVLRLGSADAIKCERCIGTSGHEAARLMRAAPPSSSPV